MARRNPPSFRTRTVPARAHQLRAGDTVLWGSRLVTLLSARDASPTEVLIHGDDGSLVTIDRDAKVHRIAQADLASQALTGAA